jgi:hypothetical protein
MLQPRCEICGRPATLHETALAGGAVVVRHLCQEHGQDAWHAVLPPLDPDRQAAALQAVEGHWRGLPEAEKEHLALTYRLAKRGR